MTEVGGAFEDPEGDTITYAVSSSDTDGRPGELFRERW